MTSGQQFLIELLNRGAEHRCGFSAGDWGVWLVVTGKPDTATLRQAMETLKGLLEAGTTVEDEHALRNTDKE